MFISLLSVFFLFFSSFTFSSSFRSSIFITTHFIQSHVYIYELFNGNRNLISSLQQDKEKYIRLKILRPRKENAPLCAFIWWETKSEKRKPDSQYIFQCHKKYTTRTSNQNKEANPFASRCQIRYGILYWRNLRQIFNQILLWPIFKRSWPKCHAQRNSKWNNIYLLCY